MDEKRMMLKDLTEEICPLFGDSLAKIILYGSYARGDYSPQSDIDLMILTKMSDEEIVAIEDQVIDIAFDYELEQKVPISVNIKNIDHFEYWEHALPYYKNIVKEGVVLAG